MTRRRLSDDLVEWGEKNDGRWGLPRTPDYEVSTTEGWGWLNRGPKLLLRVGARSAALIGLPVYVLATLVICVAIFGWVTLVEGKSAGHAALVAGSVLFVAALMAPLFAAFGRRNQHRQ